ncbi:MAG: HEAT repeat domain-containing protein [Deltaproteobacteria bacterium]|nr:HEAT repeat domain-containing protein [Deltaproteobacteria bacterium]
MGKSLEGVLNRAGGFLDTFLPAWRAALDVAIARLPGELVQGPLAAVTWVILLLLAGMLLLIGYVAVIRWGGLRRDEYERAMFDRWNIFIPACLEGDVSLEEVAATIKKSDMWLFGRYAHPYLLDFRGDEFTRLQELLFHLEYPRYLKRLLRRRSEWQRAFAAVFLGLMGDASSIPRLRLMLGDRSELVSHAAAGALMRLNDTGHLPRIIQWLSARYESQQDKAAGLLFQFGPRALPVLLDILRQPEQKPPPWMVVIFFHFFAHYVYMESTWDIVQMAIDSRDREVRIAGIRSLVVMEDPLLIQLFEDLAGDPDRVISAEAIRGLGRLGDSSHVPLVARMLELEDFWLARAAVEALLELGTEGRQALEKAGRGKDHNALLPVLIREFTGGHPAGGVP